MDATNGDDPFSDGYVPFVANSEKKKKIILAPTVRYHAMEYVKPCHVRIILSFTPIRAGLKTQITCLHGGNLLNNEPPMDLSVALGTSGMLQALSLHKFSKASAIFVKFRDAKICVALCIYTPEICKRRL